jgi:DNA-binding transcriptional LysR family regulator
MGGRELELRQLRHFVALAETGAVTQAAAREQIVQSGLLYVRGTRPIRLTAAGQALLVPARQILSAADEARARVRDTSAALTGSLRVGVLQSAEYLVPLAASLASFAREHPGVDLHLTQSAAVTMVEQVEDGRLHCGVVPAMPERPSSLRLIDLAGEPLTLVCRRDHPLASRAEIGLADLAGEWFVEVHEGWSARAVNDAAFTARGLRRRIRCEVNEWLLLVELIAAGLGVGFVPAGLPYPALTGPRSALVRRAVSDHHPRRDLQLALPRGEELSAAARAFAGHLRRATAELHRVVSRPSR